MSTRRQVKPMRRPQAHLSRIQTIPCRREFVGLFSLGLLLCLAVGTSAAETLSSMRWQQLSSQRQGLADNTVQALAVTEKVVYIGTRQGLSVYSHATRSLRTLRRAEGLPHDNVKSLLVFNGRLAIGTERGLAFLAPGETDVAPENRLASNLDIRALTEDQGALYLAASRGIYRYRAGDKTPHKIPSLATLSARRLAAVQRGVLITQNDGAVRLLDRKTQAVLTLPVELNALQNPVIAADGSGDWLWFATQGSGLIGHHFMRQEWISLGDQPEIGGYLTSLAIDGRYLWFGTFSGLFRYDTSQRKGLSTQLQDLTDKDLTCLAVDGQRIWVGTAGDGVWFGDKRHPFLSLRPFPRYVGAQAIKLTGHARGRGALRLNLEYRPAGSKRRWASNYSSVARKGGQVTGRIDFRKLPDGRYDCRLRARDQKQGSNSLAFLVVKETRSEELTFHYHTLRAGRNRISGDYSPATAQSIRLTPGKVLASLDPKQQTYTAELDLTTKDRVIEFQVQDKSGQVKRFKYRVTVLPAPQLVVVAQPLIFVPGYEKVVFTPQAKHLGDLAKWELQVLDRSGNQVYAHQAEEPLPATFTWDGMDSDDHLVNPDRLFYYTFSVWEKNGFSFTTPKKALKSHRAPPARQPRVAKNLKRTFQFDTGEAQIKNKDLDFFLEIKQLAQQHPNSMLLLEGHTDSQPINTSDYKSNQELSEARAAQVAMQLKRKFGLSTQRILTVGYGSHYPVASNEDPEERRKNRRVEITIVGR